MNEVTCMPLTKKILFQKLQAVVCPFKGKNIIDSGLVSDVLITDAKVFFAIRISGHNPEPFEPLREAAENATREICGQRQVFVALTLENSTHQPSSPLSSPIGPQPIPGVRFVIAIASGKGGVGKSTVATNLALSFASLNLRVGILDADVHGPSVPRLLGLCATAQKSKNIFQPVIKFGLKILSTGFLAGEDTPIIWRGPMITSAIMRMLFQVEWGPLDILVIDMPPGTGDVQLTVARKTFLSGALIISTPQDLALNDARRGLLMFQKLHVPIIGLIENMSYFLAPDTGKRYDIFGHGGVRKEALRLEVPFLASLPLEIDICTLSDQGTPFVIAQPEAQQSLIYKDVATHIHRFLEKAS